jgi:hypothetical protein
MRELEGDDDGLRILARLRGLLPLPTRSDPDPGTATTTGTAGAVSAAVACTGLGMDPPFSDFAVPFFWSLQLKRDDHYFGGKSSSTGGDGGGVRVRMRTAVSEQVEQQLQQLRGDKSGLLARYKEAAAEIARVERGLPLGPCGGTGGQDDERRVVCSVPLTHSFEPEHRRLAGI